jgi:phosphoribosylaminoimidazole-succinocarboxamide synthase
VSSWELPAGYTHLHSGKVRDLYLTPNDTLLMIASDRISAFDYVLPNLVPNKGKILTAISLFWFNKLAVPNHLISTEVPTSVSGRAVEVKKLTMLPIEAVVRAYLTGTAWLEYQATGEVCGIKLPVGLTNGAKLAEPIFTPATKAELGEHDENISYQQVVELIGSELAAELQSTAIDIFNQASVILNEAGFTLIDTKFEFGLDDANQLTLADEALTPDSSRYCNTKDMKPNQLAPSFDKQLVRNWLLENWDKDSGTKPPALPTEILELTAARYQEVLDRLTAIG